MLVRSIPVHNKNIYHMLSLIFAFIFIKLSTLCNVEAYLWYDIPISNKNNDNTNKYLCACSNSTKTVVMEASMRLHNRVCPDGSHERHRYMCAYFQEFNILDYLKKIELPIKVLHNAPERSIAEGFGLLNKDYINYIGFDYEVGPLVFRNGLTKYKFDLSDIPFPDNYFNFIITSHVLEHVPDMSKCLNELYRVLAPGGVGFIAAPIFYDVLKTVEEDKNQIKNKSKKYIEKLRKKLFHQADHVRIIGRDFFDLVRQSGFIFNENSAIAPQNFYFREKLKPYIPQYANTEFKDKYRDYGILFVYKPGKNKPEHLT